MDRTRTSAARCIKVLQLFLLHGTLTSAQAARHVGVPLRTVLADLELLAALAPIAASGRGRGRVWVLDPSSALGHVGILDRISLQLGRDVASFLQGTALHDGLARVDNDARGGPDERYVRHFDRKFRHLAEPARSYSKHREVLDEVLDGLLRERTLDVDYRARHSVRSYRGLEPLTLVVYRRALYLLARDPASKRVLRLGVDWMEEPEVGPGFEYPETWNPDAELSVPFGIVADAAPGLVVLRFAPQMRRFLEVRRWHPSASLHDLPDGRVEMRMWTHGRELVRFCLEWGENVEVVEPTTLRDAVVAELRGALTQYERARNNEGGCCDV